jgi:hypothetical protein
LNFFDEEITFKIEMTKKDEELALKSAELKAAQEKSQAVLEALESRINEKSSVIAQLEKSVTAEKENLSKELPQIKTEPSSKFKTI